MNLKEFQSQVKTRDPFHVNTTTDACDWYFGDTELFHERSYWGFSRDRSSNMTPAQRLWGLTKQTSFHYWAYSTYHDKNKAEKDAQDYGAVVEMEFYCDPENPSWFLIFNDLDKAIKYSFDQLKLNKVI